MKGREETIIKAKNLFDEVLPQLSDLSLIRLLGFCEGLAQRVEEKEEKTTS